MNKKIRFSFSILACLAVISCSIPNNTNNVDSNNKVSHSSNNAVIKGKAEFPELISDGFSTKATIAQVGAKATVSLIYPPDDATSPNVTIATGLTDASGMFTIDPVFSPVTNKVYILEATKRIGSSGNDVISVRTYIRNNGSGWESITTPGININATTTAITIIDSYDNTISSNDTINTVNNGAPSNIGGVTTGVISNLVNIVNNVITNDRDPVRFISYQNNKYFILRENPYNKNYLIANKSCPNCDLTNENLSTQDLTNANLKNANLTNVNLRISNLTNANLTGANITTTDFTGATWTNGSTICATGSIGKCLFPDILVNTYTTSLQSFPNIAVNDSGSYVIAWHSYVQDGSHYGVYGQRYNSAGVRQGTEFRANTVTTSLQGLPSVAMDNAGNFVVAWQSYGQDGSHYGIFAQRYNSDGTPKGSEFKVNTFTTGNQSVPSAAMDNSGNFIISWQSYGQDGDGNGVYAQRYSSDSTLTPIGTEFRVNTVTTSNQQATSVAMDSTGNFIVTWQSRYQDGSVNGIYARRFSSNPTLTPIGVEFKANTYTTNSQQTPSVTMDNSGNFIIAWFGAGTGDSSGVYAQRYSSATALTPIGSEFKVNTYTTSNQTNPSVSMDNSGNFVVAWQSGVSNGTGQDGSNYGVYAQRYSSATTLTPIGSETKINLFTITSQMVPKVGLDNTGNYVVTWQSYGQDGSSNGIYSRKYDSVGNDR